MKELSKNFGRQIDRSDRISQEISNQNFDDMMSVNHDQASARVNDYLKRNYTLAERLFSHRPLSKLITNVKLREAETEMEFRHELLKLSSTFKLQAINEKYDIMLKSIKVDMREKFSAFVTAKQANLRETITCEQDRFLTGTKEKYDKLAACASYPSLAARYEQSIEKEVERYFDWLDKLMDSFMKITEEKLKEYSS